MKEMMDHITAILSLTQNRIETICSGIDEHLLDFKPSEDHFSIRDILGHLIHGEDDDWIPRLTLMLENYENGNEKPVFEAFDRFAHRKFVEKYTTAELVTLFKEKRDQNITTLKGTGLGEEELGIEGIHPSLGEVNVEWLLNCWVAHDLSHLNQINRILVSKFTNVGPWKEYLRILNG